MNFHLDYDGFIVILRILFIHCMIFFKKNYTKVHSKRFFLKKILKVHSNLMKLKGQNISDGIFLCLFLCSKRKINRDTFEERKINLEKRMVI